jgi:GT2 family glycosyltransferase
MPKVSCIISTYNRPERLKKAIESVQKQTYTDWELIVVHDGKENEATDKIMADTDFDFGKGEKCRYIDIEHFGNDTRPKNYGIKQATGEYIAFLDDDNEFRPDHLQVLVNALEKNPDIAMVYGDRYIVDELNGQNGLGTTANFTPALLAQRNYIDTSDVLVRREALFNVGGFDERYKKYVDWNLWLRMEKYGYKFLRVPVIITDYHLHKDMKSASAHDEKAFSVPAWDPMDLEVELPYLGEVREPKVAIFSLTYDRLEYTKKCFESMYKTAKYPFDHFIVDNGSSDRTQGYLLKEKNEKKIKTVLYNDKNVGISKASNQAIDEISRDDYDIIVKVDNDCLFITDGWLKAMVELWKSNHLLIMSPYVQGLRDNPGGAQRVGYAQIKGEMIGWTNHVGGICVFADSKVYKDFRWDEDSFLHGAQDLEFSTYANRTGYQTCYLENYFLEHIEGTSGQEKRYPQYFERRKSEKVTKYESEK